MASRGNEAVASINGSKATLPTLAAEDRGCGNLVTGPASGAGRPLALTDPAVRYSHHTVKTLSVNFVILMALRDVQVFKLGVGPQFERLTVREKRYAHHMARHGVSRSSHVGLD